MAPFESVLCSSNCVLRELNLSANSIIGSGGQPIIERIVSKTSFTWVQDEPGEFEHVSFYERCDAAECVLEGLM